MREKEQSQVSDLGNDLVGSGRDWEFSVKNEDKENMNWNLREQPWAPRVRGTFMHSFLPPLGWIPSFFSSESRLNFVPVGTSFWPS